MDQFVQLITQLGFGGLMAVVIAWLVWYRETKSIPQMMELFSKEIQAERECSSRRDEDTRKMYLDTHTQQLEQHKETRHLVANLRHEVDMQKAIAKAMADNDLAQVHQ